MMYFEIDDFEFLRPRDGELDCFAPAFFVPVEWAYRRGYLHESLRASEAFTRQHERLRRAEISMSQFVSDALDYKLLDTYFEPQIREFFDIFVRDMATFLVEHFHCAPSELPNDWKAYEPICDALDEEYGCYLANRGS